MVDLAVGAVFLGDLFHLRQALFGQARQGAVDLALVGRPEVADGGVEDLLQVVAGVGVVVEETEDGIFEAHSGYYLI